MEKLGNFISAFIKGKTPKVLYSEKAEGLHPYVSPDYLRGKGNPEFFAAMTNKTIPLEDDEIIILWDGSNAGEVLLSKKGILASTMVKLLVDETKLDKKYFAYSCLNLEYILKAKTAGSGIPHADKGVIKNLPFYFPTDKAEQTAIAKILSTVDEAIRSTRETISKLERVKKALMQNLLSGKMKPDGTLRPAAEFYEDDKMGLVPKGWTVKAIGDKSICKINPNYSYVKNKEYDFIPMEAIKDKFRGVDYMEKQKIGTGSFTRFKKGDILFAKITPCSENGKVALVEEMTTDVGFASTEFIVFQPQNNIDNKYCYYLLSSGAIHRLAISLMEGTTGRQRIPWKIFKNRIFVSIPDDIEEQKMMVRNISSIEDLCKTKQEKITALESLKKSLMQQLLTGRVRVK